MMRIALLPSSYLPNLGGVEESTRHLALALNDAGDAVEVWTGTEHATGAPTVEVLDDLTVRRFPFPLPAARPGALARFPLGAIGTVEAMRRATRQFRPDIFHIHCFGPNGIYGTFLGRLTGTPVVVTLHGETVMDDHDVFARSWVMRRALGQALKRAPAVTACSAFALADAERRFGPALGRKMVVYNAVDLDETAEPFDAPTSGRSYVFALGRLVPKKGFDLLLRAFRSVADQYPGVDLVIAGTGEAASDLRSLAVELGIGNRAHLVGRLSRTEVAGALAGSVMLVVPSRVEPFGIVILEGWRAHVPVVSTSRGGPREIIEDGVNGLLVDPLDVDALAETIAKLLGDPALRRRVSSAGRQRVEAVGWHDVALQYRSLYGQVLSDHDRHRSESSLSQP